MEQLRDVTTELFDCRDAWSSTLIDLAATNAKLVAVVNDSVGSSKLNQFQREFPDRTINVGIAEQDMVGIAAGLANGGSIPFVSAAGSFLTARAMEQIKVDVAYSRYNVKLVAQSPGVAYGNLGPTHHSVEDLSWLRVLPGIVVVAPVDPTETEQVVRWAADYDGPVYIRISRMKVPRVYSDDYRFEVGKAVTLRPGRDVTIIATGTVVSRALDAATLLASGGIDARVLSLPTIKPLDTEAVLSAASETRGIVTVEEGAVSGLGGAVAEFLAETSPAPIRFLGMRDTFPPTGSAEWILDHWGVHAEGIAGKAREMLG